MTDPNKNSFTVTLKVKGRKSNKRVNVNEEEDEALQERVTGLDEAGLVVDREGRTETSVQGARKKVIPTEGNAFKGKGPRAHKAGRFLPQAGDIERIEDGAERFEVAAPEQQAQVTYGLSLMDSAREPSPPAEQDAVSHANGTVKHGRGERVVQAHGDWEREAYKRDVENLPGVATLAEYEAMPVEMFGEAMLRGMGWTEANSTAEVQATTFVRRPNLLGLGATPAPPGADSKDKNARRHHRGREPAKDLVVYDKHGNIKHTMTADDKLEERRKAGPAVGKQMRLVKGSHAGLRCKVLKIHDQEEGHSQKATVRLQPSEESVLVRMKDLGELHDTTERQEGNGLAKHSTKQGRNELERGVGRNGNAAASQDNKRSRHDSDVDDRDGDSHDEVPWLLPHIRVKIIDKHIGKGRHYLKKGEITDVMSPTTCSLLLDSGARIEVAQDQLETVIPKKEGSRVMVLQGAYRGKRARLLERSSKHDRAVLQLTEDFSLVKIDFSDFSEYVGDFGDEE